MGPGEGSNHRRCRGSEAGDARLSLALDAGLRLAMRFRPLLFAALLAVGCAQQRASNPPRFQSNIVQPPATNGATQPETTASQKPIVTPDNPLTGKVATVNGTARFVVLSFPPGHLPTVDQSLSLYRKGLKVGEVKVTGPQLDDNIVADLAAGDAQVGDEVRDK